MFAHKAAGRHKGSRANSGAAKKDGAHPDQALFADPGTVKDGAMADGHTLVQDQPIANRVGVRHHIVLNVAAMPDPDRRKISAQDSAIPDTDWASRNAVTGRLAMASDARPGDTIPPLP